ncbi:MAG TPA: glutamate-5-semialdehyde dehydrogenase [Candidatus Avacidaminococcus intestinavium]|uniref:Gamma-glutamyl phosphate reductase n=1 Tax=Candidatus Avacidaminococcus intestinavium TaxID=2840684 RepID=A0A9D1SM87_9FIRM|nr:glutamate-5-semialdehyde dehydrogenase [Candidatus Avacidaminococcus intestinavium]
MESTQGIVLQAQAAKAASVKLGILTTQIKNDALRAMAEALCARKQYILQQNKTDMETARQSGMKEAMLDRLMLTEERIEGMAAGLLKVADLPDPIGEVLNGKQLLNGLQMTKVRVPLGVIAIIYEARPNVTADAIGLCLKAGNAVVLKGGSEALQSNKAIVGVMKEAAENAGIAADAIQFIESTDRRTVQDLIKLNAYIDVVIPRGGAGLINMIVQNSTVPVIETGIGVCHTFIDESAELLMAEAIAFNAKVSRPAVCNAMETLLVHAKIAERFLPQMLEKFLAAGVSIYGCATTQKLDARVAAATEEDWQSEYGDLRLAIKVVNNIDEALIHIAQYGTHHSEAIVTSSYTNANRFQQEVDAAVVYVNASTRFTDGYEFGFGAEIGISTQKLHARGPMALAELTSTKYLVKGEGQIR